MFDTVLGLPVHALVVHAVVVLLPLAALATAVWAWQRRPERRTPRTGWLVVALDAGVTVLALVAKQSGEALQRRLGGQVALEHGSQGRWLPWLALALTAVTLLVQLSRRSGDRWPVPEVVSGSVLTVVVLVVLVWTVRVGHSGATAVWGPIVEHTGK
ncbi:DUF2231 domain-containing protein [Pedococcus sp. 5OH_020]|uniref:DUF2231 domain-containing protein n=1 Tax=Pedococcus sp. 5OH_020 TaxID=2989814 RepID=UPI0022EA0E03|nr:DUF2231 domain-containing protein [Pedococcus sp. 5OH_020]